MAGLMESLIRWISADNPPDSRYTMKELKARYDSWVGAGNFVGLMDRGTPLPVQEYCYRQMRGGWAFLNFFDDIAVLLYRKKSPLPFNLYNRVIYKPLYRFHEYASNAPNRKEKREQRRIKKAMLKGGCWVGTGDYYFPKKKEEPSHE